MSSAINIKEHNTAFVKFLILFFVTVAMLAGALYFDFSTPKKELEILRERSDLLRDQNLAQENYKRTLLETIAVIDRLDSSTSKAIVSSELEPKLATLRNSLKIDDSTSSKSLNVIVTELVNKYKNARFDFEDSRGFQDELRRKEKEIVELKDRLDRSIRNEIR
jgi:type III secretory pathway component EscV